MHIGSGLATVPDGNGNNLFGSNTLEGFVLDQNQYSFTGNYVPALASAAQFGQPTVNYGFNQPLTATSLPADVPGIDEAGFQEQAATAKANCPVSKALAAVEITLDASLVT